MPGAYVVTLDGEPVLYAERGGKAWCRCASRDDERAARGARRRSPTHVRTGRIRRLAVERFDGEPVVGSESSTLLIELGFRQGPRKLTLSA